jgi:hypothetical protein
MPSTSSVRVDGIREVTSLLGNIGAAARALSGFRVRAMSRLPYAYGIRTGHHRGGRLARRAGGTYAIDKAKDEVVSQMLSALAAALPKGADAAQRVALDTAQKIVDRVQSTEAVKSGNLRASYHVERG